MRASFTLLLFGSVVVACQPTAQQTTPDTPSAATRDADPDVRAAGATGVPSGYRGVADRPNANVADARYVAAGNGWEVTTGPAHIVFNPAHVASGNYTVSATLEQLARPRHPEAFGLFFGGRDLETPNRAYTYFLVRGTGEMFARRRTGETLHGLIDWQRHTAVPVADSAGRATYTLQVRVARDSVRFSVNDRLVAVLPRSAMPTDGIAGLRINHNLSLRVTPVTITRN